MATEMVGTGGWLGIGWRILMWGTAALLLSLPLIGMKFFPTWGVNWTGSDFVAMGIVLIACCSTVELGASVSRNHWYQGGFAVAVLAAFGLTWVSLAVGIINDLSDPANLMFVGVLATGVIGAIAARLRPQGMAVTLVAVTVVQLLVGVIALLQGKGIEAIAFGVFLSALWLASAALFRQAARDLAR